MYNFLCKEQVNIDQIKSLIETCSLLSTPSRTPIAYSISIKVIIICPQLHNAHSFTHSAKYVFIINCVVRELLRFIRNLKKSR